MKVLHSVPYSYEVLHDEATGKYVLSALCGGFAMFMVDIDLTEDEIRRFNNDNTGLDYLAYEVQQHSGRAKK